MRSVEFDVANAMAEGIENNFKGKSHKKVDFSPYLCPLWQQNGNII